MAAMTLAWPARSLGCSDTPVVGVIEKAKDSTTSGTGVVEGVGDGVAVFEGVMDAVIELVGVAVTEDVGVPVADGDGVGEADGGVTQTFAAES